MTTKPKTTTGDYGAKDITFWESDLDKIRARPQMYIGSTDGATGIFSVVRECLDNSVDEFQAGHAKVLDIIVADDYSTYTIKDDGRGIPVAMHPVAKKPTLTVVLSYLQTSGKINAGKGKAYENSIGCFTGDTLLTSTDGMETCSFAHLYERRQNPAYKINLVNSSGNKPFNIKSLSAGTGEHTTGSITHVQISKYTDRLSRVVLSNGHAIESTPNHPYYVYCIGGSLQVKLAENLVVGDTLVSSIGGADPILVIANSIINLDEPVPVYGITVEPHHTYALAAGVYVGNTHGVGAKATNALSDKFTAITCNNGKWFKTEFAKGKEKLKPTACKAPTGMRKGTLISFSPDVTVFKKHANTVPQISAWADLTSRLNPGIRIRLTHKGKTKEWFEPGGIKSLVESRAAKLEATPIGKLFEYHSSHMDLALSFTNAEGDLIDAYTNTVKNAEGGVHLNALRSALYDVLKAYLRKGEKMTPHDLLEGVIGVLNYKIAAPRFDSQTKEKLVDERVGEACRTECIEALQAFFDKNKKMADQIVLQAVQLREATNEFRKNKELTRKLKVAKKSKILLPDKLTASLKCAPGKRELYAVEGDSAAGCHFGDTKVLLADGTTKDFDGLVQDFNQGKDNYGLAFDRKNKKPVRFKLFHPRITKTVTDYIEMTLEDGTIWRGTPCHLWLCSDGKYRRADSLTTQDDLVVCQPFSNQG